MQMQQLRTFGISPWSRFRSGYLFYLFVIRDLLHDQPLICGILQMSKEVMQAQLTLQDIKDHLNGE